MHINKKFKLSQDKEVITQSDQVLDDKDCMIVDYVPRSITQVPAFKMEHFPSTFVLSEKPREGAKNQ